MDKFTNYDEVITVWNEHEKEFIYTHDFSDVSIKVEETSFKVHRFILALQSEYFEKLFVGDYLEHDSKEIEIEVFEKHVFAALIKLVYGDSLSSVINAKNVASLWLAMDYFQMETLKNRLESFIQKGLSPMWLPSLTTFNELNKMIDLYVTLESNLNSRNSALLLYMRAFFSAHLWELSNAERFPSLSLDSFKLVLETQPRYKQQIDPPYPISYLRREQIDGICAKWICHDINERLNYIVILANAVRYRQNTWYLKIQNETLNKESFLDNDKEKTCENVERYFRHLRSHHGTHDIDFVPLVNSRPTPPRSPSSTKQTCQSLQISEREKYGIFLNNEYFYDIVIVVEEKEFRLHRIVLAAASKYFYEILLPLSNSPQITQVRLPDDIDAITFHMIIRYIYKLGFEPTDQTDFLPLLRASKLFELWNLFEACVVHILLNCKYIDKDKIMDVIVAIEKYEFYNILSNTLFLPVFANSSQIKQIRNFFSKSTMTLLEKVFSICEFNSESEIIDLCVKWISHDKTNRYHHISHLASIVTCNPTLNCIKFEKNDSENFSQKEIEQKLLEILNNEKRLPPTTNEASLDRKNQPFFLISSPYNKSLRFVNADFEDIEGLYPLQWNRGCEKSNNMEELINSAATIIKENLFVAYKIANQVYFNCYNFPSKKYYSLSSEKIESKNEVDLLNCGDQVYYCSRNDGRIWKYSSFLNRWFAIRKEEFEGKSLFTSDGTFLYEIRQHSLRCYDERMNSWSTLSHHEFQYSLVHASIINQNVCVLHETHVNMFDRQSQQWSALAYTNEIEGMMNSYGTIFENFKQNKEEILFIGKNLLYSYSTHDHSWSFKRSIVSNITKTVHF